MIDDVRQALQRQRGLLEVLPEVGHPQQRAGDVARQDPEGDQLTQGHLTFEHQRGTNPEDNQTGELLQELTGRSGCCAGDDVAEARLDLSAVELLPAPTAMDLHALALDRLHPAEGFHQMALHAGIRFGLLPQLLTDDGCRQGG